MKILYSTLFSFFALASFAQLNQATHAPAAGDKWYMWNVDPAGVNPGASGAGAVWNFSAVTTESATVRGYTASAVTSDPTFTNANIMVTSSLSSSSAVDNNYYTSTAQDLDFLGGTFNINIVSAKLTYTNQAKMAIYPLNLNGTNTSAIAGTIQVTAPTSAAGEFTGTAQFSVDGTGTLVIPGTLSTFSSVTRIKTVQNISFTVASFIGPVSGTLHQTMYEYFAAGVKAPVFSINTLSASVPATGPQTQTIVLRNRDAVGIDPTPPQSTVGIAQNAIEQISLSVYPNPASETVYFKGESKAPVILEIFDITGKKVAFQQLSNGVTAVDLSAYQNGLYIYKIKSSSNTTLRTGKLTVVH